MAASVGLLKDDFELAAPASAWMASASGSATYAQTSGQARFTLPSSTAGSHVARYTSRVTYDLTGANFFINIGTMVATGVVATAFFQTYLNTANTLQWRQESGTIYARKVVAGVSTDLFSAAWSGTTYKYLRISEAAGTVTWWSSTNGTSWTSRATLVGLPFAVTDLFIDYGATCGNVASPGSFRLDDVNLLLPALTTAWNWTQVVWPFHERTETITVAIDVVGSVMGCVVTADEVDASDAPSGNVRYWAGPMDAGRILTEQPTLAAAQAMAVYFPLDGRMDLETMVEGHCYRIYHRSVDGNSYIIRELFPRRTIYADDIKAESIVALHIRAGSITADRLFVTELSAITANAGTITAGIINGATIYVGALDDIILDGTNGMTLLPGSNIAWSAGGPGTSEVAISYAGTTWGLTAVGKKIVIGTTGGITNTITLSTTSGAPVIVGGPLQITTDTLIVGGVTALRGAAINSAIALSVKGTGTTNATAAISATSSGGLIDFQALDDGTIRTRTGNRVDFRGVTSGIATATKHWDVMIDGTLIHLLGY